MICYTQQLEFPYRQRFLGESAGKPLPIWQPHLEFPRSFSDMEKKMFGRRSVDSPFMLLMAEELVRSCAEERLKLGPLAWVSKTTRSNGMELVKRSNVTITNNEKNNWYPKLLGHYAPRDSAVQIYEFCPTFTGTVTNSTGSEVHEIEGTCRLYRVSPSYQGWRPHFIDLTIDGESEFHVSEDGLTIIDGESELSVFENGEIGGNEACDNAKVPSSVRGLMVAGWMITVQRRFASNE